MMIKEIYVEIKRCKNYQTYTAGELITIDSGDDITAIRNAAYARCRKVVGEQMGLDNNKLSGGV